MSAIRLLTSCVEELDIWMTSNRLKFNADKTLFIWTGTRQQLSKIGTAVIMLKGHPVVPARSVTCLGVNIDCELTFAQHTKRTAANCFYQIRQLWTIRRALSADNARMLVHALVSSRVDYCNSVLHRVAVVHLRPLQSVVNAAARLITKKRKIDPISATLLDELHCLPVRQ